jgi:hypothetical protein
VLLEFIGEENTVVTRILQQVSQFVILSVTQRRKTNPTVSTHLLPSPAQDQKKDEMFQSK